MISKTTIALAIALVLGLTFAGVNIHNRSVRSKLTTDEEDEMRSTDKKIKTFDLLTLTCIIAFAAIVGVKIYTHAGSVPVSPASVEAQFTAMPADARRIHAESIARMNA